MGRNDQVKQSPHTATPWDNHAAMYEMIFERSTWLWGRDALILAGFPDAQTVRAATQPLRLLDVACGAGKLAVFAAEMGFRVTAVDFSLGMIQHLQAKLKQSHVENVDVRALDGHTLEGIADDSFDLVSSFFGACLFSDRCAAWRSARRVLKPNGQLLVSSWHEASAMNHMTKYMVDNALDKPGMELEARQTLATSLYNRTLNVASFTEELIECGFTDVSLFAVKHAMSLVSGRELVDGLLDNGYVSHILITKDVESVKLCGIHFCQLLADGVDPFTAPLTEEDGVTSLFEPRDGRRAEDHPLWNKPIVIEGAAVVGTARKPGK